MGLLDSFVTLVVIAGGCLYTLYTRDFEWEKSQSHVSYIASSASLNLELFILCRLFFTCILLATLFWEVFLDHEGLHLKILTRDRKQKHMHIRYLVRLTFFTHWCWLLLGVYFTMVSISSLCVYFSLDLSSLIGHNLTNIYTKIAWVLFEVI